MSRESRKSEIKQQGKTDRTETKQQGKTDRNDSDNRRIENNLGNKVMSIFWAVLISFLLGFGSKDSQ